MGLVPRVEAGSAGLGTFWPGKDLTSPSPASSSPSPARRESPLFIRAGLGLGGDAQLGAGRKPKKRRERGPRLRTLSRSHARGSPLCAADPCWGSPACTGWFVHGPPCVCGACLQSLPGRSGAWHAAGMQCCSMLTSTLVVSLLAGLERMLTLTPVMPGHFAMPGAPQDCPFRVLVALHLPQTPSLPELARRFSGLGSRWRPLSFPFSC